MNEPRFHLVFSGQLVPGADLATVQENLGRLLNVQGSRLQALFSGRPVVLKKNADQATAMKLRARLKQAGAQVEMRPVDASPDQPAPVAAAAPPPPADEPSSSGDREMVGTIRTGGTGFTGPWQVAEVGADLDTEPKQPDPQAPDISHLSMAPPGEDLLKDKPAKPAPAAVRTDHITLSED